METLVSRELAALGIDVERVEPGRARFNGTMDDLYRSLIHLRCASRVVREIAFEQLVSEEDVYEAARSIDWSRWMTPESTFRVQFNVHSSLLRNSRFGLYRIKDAICDRMVQERGRRPGVDLQNPQVCVYCYLENRRFSVGLDASGDPLHMRGYRVAQHEASLREHLAAAMVLQSGWDPARPLHDPFCGSATILTEAVMIGMRMPPSRFRKHFGCEGWPDFDPKRFSQLRAEAMTAVQPVELDISGADSSLEALQMARDNVASCGFGKMVRLHYRPVERMPPIIEGWIVTNPPYGIRLASEPDVSRLYRAFRERALACRGSTVAVLHADEEFERAFALRPSKRNRLNNGPIACSLLQYRIMS